MRFINLGICFLTASLVLSACGKKAPLPQAVSPAPNGWDVGNGGSGYAAEFKDIGRTVVRRLKGKGITETAGISVTEFGAMLEAAVVETTELPLKKGESSVDALNFPSRKTVRLSLVHWAQKMEFPEKRRLVIHEILGLLGKEDAGFTATDQVLKALGRNPVYFNKFTIHGEVARVLMEKMFWQSVEIKTETLPEWHSINYKIPHDSKNPEIECSHVEYKSPFRDNETTDLRCTIRKHAYLGEDGILHVSLVNEDGDHALWRLFDHRGGNKFDWGVIKGDLSKLLFTLEFFL